MNRDDTIERANAEPEFRPPYCVFVTGPTGRGRSRWVYRRIGEICAQRSESRCAVLVADETLIQGRQTAASAPNVAVQFFPLACLCHPALADLPRAVRTLAKAVCPDWLFIEIAALAAASLIAHFDRFVGCQREIVVWLNHEWASMRCAQTLSFYQSCVLELADRVIEESSCEPSSAQAPTLSFV